MISRPFFSALVLTVVAALAPPRAESCSIVISYGPVEERERLNNSLQAPDFQFWYWHDDHGPFGMELADADGRTIPSRIDSSRIPYPHLYPMAQAYSVLVPAHPLRPGRYTLRTVIDVSWAPMLNGRPDISRKRAASGMLPLEVRAGRRTLNLPGWWFEGLQTTDRALWFELKRINRTGRRSAATAVTVQNAALLATARR